MAFKKENPGDFITVEDISKLKYTNKVHIQYTHTYINKTKLTFQVNI